MNETSQENGGTREGWSQLESTAVAPTQGEFRVYDTGIHNSHGAVVLALDASGLRHVLVPVASDFAEIFDRRSGGVHLTSRSLIDESKQRNFLDLGCQKLHLNSIFTHVAEELLNALRSEPDNPLQICRQTLQRWRELLDREDATVLSTEALCGLFGELWHLNRITSVATKGIMTWHGPHSARHDFSKKGLALEIKTTLSRDEWKFRIHGLQQLADPAVGDLYLCGMRLELNGPSGTTVPELLQLILQTGVDRRDLIALLAKIGYDMRDEAHYEQFLFDVIDIRAFCVDATFPRLVNSSFTFGPPDGVADVHYTIDLATSLASAISTEELNHIHTILAGECDESIAGSAV